MKEINQVAIYKPVGLKVKIKNENTWLTQSQISFLFQVDRSVVTKHLKNIFETGELREKSNVQKMHIANSDKPVKAYNLDVIISVGYRVNSIRATQFRIWATKTLKQYLVKGYVLNQKRLKEQQKSLKTLSDSVALIKSKIYSPQLTGQESELLEIVKTYIDSLRLLKLYDDQQLKTTGLKTPVKFILDYEISTTNINKLKQNLIKQNLASDNFGLENGEALKGLIGAISQTYDSRDLYRSIEEKAANLLYFIIKDHPFVDGNKRIASTLFIYFLSKNNFLFKENGETKINDRALVALALLVAVSDPKEKDTIVKLIINLIKD
jgi:death-on-curing family protein